MCNCCLLQCCGTAPCLPRHKKNLLHMKNVVGTFLHNFQHLHFLTPKVLSYTLVDTEQMHCSGKRNGRTLICLAAGDQPRLNLRVHWDKNLYQPLCITNPRLVPNHNQQLLYQHYSGVPSPPSPSTKPVKVLILEHMVGMLSLTAC